MSSSPPPPGATRHSFTTNPPYKLDPDWVAEDRDAIVEAIGAARGKLGDLPLDLTTIIGSHHDVVLYTWHLGPAAEPVAKGYGVLHINDGVVETAYNFFG
ncbi:hypothetical protein [Streptomyces sp. NPDC058255]|uniref:hypothetical protein n=1 Tax=Streptomyces sp. NPDC058255 TaxID=3346407 RepID=UPI0036E52CF8